MKAMKEMKVMKVILVFKAKKQIFKKNSSGFELLHVLHV